VTDKQKRFCEEYLVDLNATQAAIRAGYSPKSASVTGAKLLTNAKVRARIDAAMAEQSKRTGVNADRVIRELARIAFVNPTDVIDTEKMTVLPDATKDDTAAIASVKVKLGDSVEREIRFHDKNKALELLGRHLGMFNDKLNVTAEGAVKIIDDIKDTEGDKDC
jgi:phage terminase small subunit